MIKEVKSGIIIAITFLFVIGIAGVGYAALSGLKATGGETLTVSKWDSLVNHSVPSGAINAFYLSSCPDNWKAADGTNGTPDLRGQFLRGMNDFGSLEGTRADGNQNPETKSLGEYQSDEVGPHTHDYIRSNGRLQVYSTGGNGNPFYYSYNDITGINSGNESRPKNVSVIFCIKE